MQIKLVAGLVIAGLYGAIVSSRFFRVGLSPSHGPIFTLAFMAAFPRQHERILTAMLFFTENPLFATASLAVLSTVGVSTLVSKALSPHSVNAFLIETNDVLKLDAHKRQTFRVVLKSSASIPLRSVHKTLKKEAIHPKGINFKDAIHKLESTLTGLHTHYEAIAVKS